MNTVQGLAAGRVVFGDRVVRGISERQASFINKLLNERKWDAAKLPFNADGSLDVNLRHASRIIDYLLSCPKTEAEIARPASDKQLAYLKSLVDQRQGGDEFAHLLAGSPAEAVSAAIEALRERGYRQPLEVGAYNHEGVIYSVRKNVDNNRRYAVHYKDGAWSERNYDIVWSIKSESRLTLAEAVAFGAQTGCCIHCGRTLTVKKSVVAGMGKVCASKYQ